MTVSDLYNYYVPASRSLFGYNPVMSVSLALLDQALGIAAYATYMRTEYVNDSPLDEEIRQLLIKLAGPHGKTILKAYRIRKGLEA